MDCKNLAGCAFVGCCEQYSSSTSVQGFVNMYCKGSRMSECVRLRLSEKCGKLVVPKNMMPNGYPLPGTTKEGWSSESINYNQYI